MNLQFFSGMTEESGFGDVNYEANYSKFCSSKRKGAITDGRQTNERDNEFKGRRRSQTAVSETIDGGFQTGS